MYYRLYTDLFCQDAETKKWRLSRVSYSFRKFVAEYDDDAREKARNIVVTMCKRLRPSERYELGRLVRIDQPATKEKVTEVSIS